MTVIELPFASLRLLQGLYFRAVPVLYNRIAVVQQKINADDFALHVQHSRHFEIHLPALQ